VGEGEGLPSCTDGSVRLRGSLRSAGEYAVFEFTATSDRVFVKDGREMLVTDRALNLIEQLPLFDDPADVGHVLVPILDGPTR